MSDDPAATVRAFADLIWNARDVVTGEVLFAPGFQHHDLVTHRETDLNGYLSSIRYQRQEFPGVRFEINETVVQGDRVATRWTIVGVHAASGRAVTVSGMSIDRLVDGKIAENWTVWDRHGLLEQLRTDAGSEAGYDAGIESA